MSSFSTLDGKSLTDSKLDYKLRSSYTLRVCLCHGTTVFPPSSKENEFSARPAVTRDRFAIYRRRHLIKYDFIADLIEYHIYWDIRGRFLTMRRLKN